MTFALAAAITAIILFIVSFVQRRQGIDAPWIRQLIIALRLAVLAFVGLYLFFRLTA